MISNNSNNPVNQIFETIKQPIHHFFRIEASGGILLLIATFTALFWANGPFAETYDKFWHEYLSLSLLGFELSDTLLHWINDGLMAIFFFVVGLEIKREMLSGELRSFNKAILPVMAAIGGMLIPGLIFFSLNHQGPQSAGWGIPMATDIAFSLGVLSLLGKRVPISLKIFLVAFAIVDDIGAVLIIAFFYSANIEWNLLLASLGLIMLLFAFNYFRVRNIAIYMIVGWIVWYLFYKSGVHPSIAGVLIAFTIPANRKINIFRFKSKMDKNLVAFCDNCSDKTNLTKEQLESIDNIQIDIARVQSPLQSLEHTLHGFTTYLVMPLFALANAGVAFAVGSEGIRLFADLSRDIEISLIFGKVIGIALFTYIAIKTGIAILPNDIKWKHIFGVGFLGGMGFTMSLFITNLAYKTGEYTHDAKIGILVGSLVAGIVGYLILYFTLSKEDVR